MSRTKLGAVIVVCLGVLTGGAIVAAVNNDDRTAGSAPDLDVEQQAIAKDAGVSLAVNRAAFSGTGTFLELEVSLAENEGSANIVRIEIPPNGLAQGSLQLPPGAPPPSLAIGHKTPIRFEAASIDEPPVLELQSVEVFRTDGTSAVLPGHWRLPLTVPGDLRSRLQTEHLAGDAVTDGAVRVAVEGAIRSKTETILTVRYDFSEPLRRLLMPSLLVDGERLFGAEISESGGLVTYAFPATKFGTDVAVRFGPFVRTGDAATGTARVDLGTIVRRHDLGGHYPETAEITPADVVSRDGALGTPTVLRFGTFGQAGQSGGNRTAEVTFPGVLASGGNKPEDLFRVIASNGQELKVATFYVSLGQNSAGVQGTNPRTSVAFFVESLDTLEGPVTISYTGNPNELVRGEWLVTLRPV